VDSRGKEFFGGHVTGTNAGWPGNQTGGKAIRARAPVLANIVVSQPQKKQNIKKKSATVGAQPYEWPRGYIGSNQFRGNGKGDRNMKNNPVRWG